MPYEEVTVIEAPISSRYFNPGTSGQIDHVKSQIRVGGAWFDYDTKRWKVISTNIDVKKKAMLEELSAKSFIPDREFVDICEKYAVPEETVMEWMVETNNFTRYQLTPGWSVHKTKNDADD